MYKIIEITTPTCSVCKMLKPMIEKVMAGFKDVIFEVYDYQDSEVQYYMNKFAIKSVPAFFFIAEGEIVDSHFGAIGLPELKKKVENLKNAA